MEFLKKNIRRLCPLLFLIIIAGSDCKKNSGTNPVIIPPVTPPSTGKTFKNPLLANAPDPYVIKVDSIYYYCNTLGDHIGIRKTAAMSKLFTSVYVTVFTPSSPGPGSENLWAPEFYFLNNKWYLY